MRVFKSEDEVVQMRRVGQASGRAFTESMRQTFTMEKDLTNFLEYNFKKNGCDGSAFVPVVAGGSVGLLPRGEGIVADCFRMLWPFTIRGTTMSYGMEGLTRTCTVNYILTDQTTDKETWCW